MLCLLPLDAGRISIPTFRFPGNNAFIAPATSMVDEQQPVLYRGNKFEEFFGAFWSHQEVQWSLHLASASPRERAILTN